MDINCQPKSAPTKLFTSHDKPRMLRASGYVDQPVYDELLAVAEAEQLEFSATVRELLTLALRLYKHKRGTLNANLPQNKKTFYCQSCMVETRIREVCYKTLDFDQYLRHYREVLYHIDHIHIF